MNPGLPGHKSDADIASPATSMLPGTTTFPPSIPGVVPPQIPDHELMRLIGRGAYGEVWMARNAVGTLRAIKIVHRSSFQRAEHFEREFKGLLKFEPISRSHDGLVDVLQIGRRDDAGYFYYVMELADDAKAERSNGEVEVSNSEKTQPTQHSTTPAFQQPSSYVPRTLRSELRQRASLTPAECITLGLKLASALEHLHSNGLVHRDIKPSNIIFVKGEPKLADIGLVTAIDDAQSLVGTTGYIPPEGPGTPRADLYSLGKVLYEIAFGKDRQEFPELPPDLPSHPDYTALLELNDVILKACESDPRQRYASASLLARDLALLQHGQSVKQVRTRARRWKAARQFALVTIGLAALATTVTLVNRTTHGHTPNPEAKRLYELGKWYYSQLTPEDHERALEALTQAVKKDPKFIRPYGEWMALYTWNMLPGITNEQIRLQKVREIADKAQKINPNSAEGHTALSWCRFLQRDWRGAEDEIKRAIRLNPDLALAHDIYCFYLSMQGRIHEAEHEGQRAQELEPPSSARVTAIIASWPFTAERRHDLAIVQLKRVLELDRNFSMGHNYLGECYEAESNYVAAIEEFKTSDLLSGEDPDKVDLRYRALRAAFDTAGEQGYLRKQVEFYLADHRGGRDLAGYYARLGEKEKALAELEAHFDEPQEWHQIKFLPLYDPLHDEPRFKALVKRAGLEP